MLLKNEHQILPLKREDSIAVFGAFADTPRYQGGGSSHTNPTKVTNTLDALCGYTSNLEFLQGFGIFDEKCDEAALETAKRIALNKDKVVICAGLPERYETEGIDRTHLSLPSAQVTFIEEIAKVNANIVVVLNNGAPIEMPFVSKAKGILEAYLPGQAGGEAIAISYLVRFHQVASWLKPSRFSSSITRALSTFRVKVMKCPTKRVSMWDIVSMRPSNYLCCSHLAMA